MDDDGLPDAGLPRHGCSSTPDLDFWGPVVVDEDDPDRLVFPIRLPGRHPDRARGWTRSARPPRTA